MKNDMTEHLVDYRVINNSLYGFTNVLEFSEEVYEKLDKCLDVVHLAFVKPFAKGPHIRLG